MVSIWHRLPFRSAVRLRDIRWTQRALLSVTPPSSTFYDSTVEKYASAPLQKMNLAEMFSIGMAALRDDDYLLQHARFVQTELPKRLARRLLDLRFLPHIMITNPHIRHVYDAYYKALGVLLPLPEIKTTEQNAEFTEILQNLLDEQTSLLDDLAAGLRECLVKKSITDRVNLQPFVEDLLRSRISRRVMAQHHIDLYDRKEGFVGCICQDLNVCQALQDAASRAQSVCRRIYGTAPEVRVEKSDRPVSMPYVPAHLDYMLFELLKNSMKALMEHTVGSVPDIRVMICESPSTVTIKISDEGGGIDPELIERVWQYGYSTTHNQSTSFSRAMLPSFWMNAQQTSRSGLSGYGFGLPFTRLHARYFGGDVQFVSIPGFGMDVFLMTKKLDREAWNETTETEYLERLEYKAAEINRFTG